MACEANVMYPYFAPQNYRVNLVKDSESLSTILAQSNDFEVLAASSSTSASASQTVAAV